MEQLRDDIEVRLACDWMSDRLPDGRICGCCAASTRVLESQPAIGSLCTSKRLIVAMLPAPAPLQAFNVQLTPECLADIEQVFRKYRDPAFN